MLFDTGVVLVLNFHALILKSASLNEELRSVECSRSTSEAFDLCFRHICSAACPF